MESADQPCMGATDQDRSSPGNEGERARGKKRRMGGRKGRGRGEKGEGGEGEWLLGSESEKKGERERDRENEKEGERGSLQVTDVCGYNNCEFDFNVCRL